MAAMLLTVVAVSFRLAGRQPHASIVEYGVKADEYGVKADEYGVKADEDDV